MWYSIVFFIVVFIFHFFKEIGKPVNTAYEQLPIRLHSRRSNEISLDDSKILQNNLYNKSNGFHDKQETLNNLFLHNSFNSSNDDEVENSKNIKAYLYINNDTNTSYEIDINNSGDAPIDINCPLEVLTHGWGGDGNLSWIMKMKDTFIESGCNNVIIADWANNAAGRYETAVANVPKTGAYIGKILMSIIDAKNLTMENVRVRAFSLGAHVAGYIGKAIYSETGKKIGRITGMDPAGPSFTDVSSNERLDKEDAMFVDIIHTGGLEYGLIKEIGHADFYPNRGYIQPCSILPIVIFICSHNRAHEYFTESIITNKFLSTPCNSWKNFTQGKCDKTERVSMGYYLDTEVANGTYYLYTNIFSPYARG